MAQIPLFIHSPVSDSVVQALPFVEEKGVFAIHSLKFDNDIFPLLLDLRPCVVIFSIPGPESSRQVCGMLESFRLYRTGLGFPPRDPTLRIILVAEQRAMAIERWHELGVHEFIIAPILPRALAFKVVRHHQRAGVSQVPEPEMAQEEEIVVVQSGAESKEHLAPGIYKVVETPLEPDAVDAEIRYKTPSASGTPAEPSGKIAVTVSIPELQEKEGRWLGNPMHSGSEDKKFEWTWYPPKDKQTTRKWSYTGEEPVFDKNAGAWKLLGENPELVLKDENGKPQKMISVEKTEKGREVVVDERIDVHKVSERSFRRHTSGLAATDKSVPTLKNKMTEENVERKSGWKVLDSPEKNPEGTKEKPPGATEEVEEKKTKTKTVLTIEEEDDSESRSLEDRRRDDSSASSSHQAGARALVSDPSSPKEWHSLSPEENSEPGDDAPVEVGPSEESERRLRTSLSSKIRESVLKETPLKKSESEISGVSGFPKGKSPENSEAEPKEKSQSKSRSDAQTEIEDSAPQNPELDEPQSDGSEAEVNPMFEKLEAALLGKERPKPTIRRESAHNEKDKTAKTHFGEDAKPSSGKQLRTGAANRSERDLKGRLGNEVKEEDNPLALQTSDEKKEDQDFKIKSGDDIANTWSMQNLDEIDALGKASEIAKLLASGSDLTPAQLEASNMIQKVIEQVKQTPMDPEERARLLKKVYDSLNLKMDQKPEEKDGFFARFIKKITALLRAERK